MISYLNAGGAVDAAAFNTLYADFSRKLGLLLGGCSPYLVAHFRPKVKKLLGRTVYFVNPALPRAYTLDIASSHNEALYTTAASSVAVGSWDDTLKIGNCAATTPDLDDGLIAHWTPRMGTRYYLRQPGRRPERRHPYGVLDVVVEGPTAITIPDEWDKYWCVRVHNLNAFSALTVNFGTEFDFTIPRFQCRAYRVDRPEATGPAMAPTAVTEEGKYFWLARPTDPFPLEPKHYEYWPERSYRANNILHPLLALEWIDALRTPDIGAECGWEIDESFLAPVIEGIEDFFADPTNPDTILGDLIHHAGDLYVERTGYDSALIPFPGYHSSGTMSDLVRVESDGTGGFRLVRLDPMVDRVAGVGTNLLENGAGIHGESIIGGGGIALSKPIDLCLAGTEVPWSLTTATGTAEHTVTAEWVDLSGVTHEVSGDYTTFTGSTVGSIEYTFTAGQTVGAIAAKSAAVSVSDAALTPLGPTFVLTRPLDVSLPGWAWGMEKYVLRIKGHGWATLDFDGDLMAESVFLWPRHRHTLWPRLHRYHRPFGQDTPPDATGLEGAFGGAPWKVATPDIILPVAQTDKHTLAPIGQFSPTAPLARQWWSSWSDEYGGILRVPRTAEWFNRLAWRINQLRRGRPLCLADLKFARPGGVMWILPSDPETWDVVPRDFHCIVPEGNLSAWTDLVDALGGWINGEVEMPASWHATRAAQTNGANRLNTYFGCQRTCSGASVTSVEHEGETQWLVSCTATYQLQVTHETVPLQPVQTIGGTPSSWSHWISDASAAAMANSIGVAMIRTRLGYGFRMELQAPAAPLASGWNVNTHTQEIVFAPLSYEPAEWEVAAMTATTILPYGAGPDYFDYALLSRVVDFQPTIVYQRPAMTPAEAEFVGPAPGYLSRASDGRDQLDLVTDCPGSSLEPASSLCQAFDGTWNQTIWNFDDIRPLVGEYHLAANTGLDDAAIGNLQAAIAVTAHSGSSLRNDSKVAVTPTWLWHRQANFQSSEATWIHLRNYFGGGVDPRPVTYEAPNPASGGLVACSGQATVITPPGAAAFISAKFEIVVDLDAAP